jgi:class 3 adenylate cyclase
MVRIGGDVTVDESRVVNDAVAIGGSGTVLSGGRVMGDAVAIGGDVNLKANARVWGDAVAIGGEILEVIVRAIGNDLHMDCSAIGQTTHLAARME